MPSRSRSTFWYDVTRELRRLALRGLLEERFPGRAAAIGRALEAGDRIVFSPDRDEFYREFELDQLLVDPRTGRTCGGRLI